MRHPQKLASQDWHRFSADRAAVCAEGLPSFLVDDEDVGLRMVHLDNRQRSGSLKRSGNRGCRLDDRLFAALLRSLLKVNVLEASHYRSTMRRLQPDRNAVRLYVPDQLRDRRSGPLQVE